LRRPFHPTDAGPEFPFNGGALASTWVAKQCSACRGPATS